MGLEDPFHGISAGQSYTYYALEMRCTHRTEYGKPDGPLLPITEESGWDVMGWDSYGCYAEPWGGKGNDYKPLFKEAHNETHDVWAKTGRHGWWTRKFADLALERMQLASAEKKLTHTDGRGNVLSVSQYAFRIIKVTVSKTVEVVDPEIVLPPNIAAADPLPEHLIEFYAFETIGITEYNPLRRGLVLEPGPTIPLTSGEERKVVPLTANP